MDRGSMPNIGAHVSAAGGFAEAVTRAEAIGADAMQVFGSSPRTWRTIMPKPDAVLAYKKRLAASSIRPVFLHAAYLVNLGSASPELRRNSVQSLTDHLRIAELIGAEGLIFHIGSSKGMAREEALTQEVTSIREILKAVPGKARLIMENTAGGGEKIGAGIEEIAYLFHKAQSDRLAVCFDTAHGFEAGLVEAYTKDAVKSLFDAWDKAVGIEHIVAIHANDSKTPAGSHHDRHENIGEGFIGIDGFKALAADDRLRRIPWILEVPGIEGNGPDRENVDMLRSCFKK